jgi:kynureninase
MIAGDAAVEEAYFLYHSIGMYPEKSRDLAHAMAEFAACWGRPDDAQWGHVLPLRARFTDRWRRILNAPDGTVTTCESVTAGFHAILTALPEALLRGKTVLVAADCFPSNHFLLQRLAPVLGFRVKTVPLRQGAAHVEDEDFLAAWTPDVGLALLTWVSSTSSARIDLAAMVAKARKAGSLVGVDITQAAGLLPFDVMAPQVDFALSTSLKWMCGTPGAGVIYLTPRLVPDCHPHLQGWFSQDNPFNWDISAFSPAPDIRRFDNGTPGCMAAIASLPALDWHAGQDHALLLAHNRSLTERLFDMAADLKLTALTPRAKAQRGGSVMLRLPDRHPAPAIIAALREQGISADSRAQTLRLSPGVLTTAQGVAHLHASLAKALHTTGR